MSNAAYLPPPARPPHDPLRLPLDAHAGWRIGLADKVEAAAGSGVLVLAPAPGQVRLLNEAGGGFGGLAPPSHVAVAGETILLLDRPKGLIRRFDACECRFDTIPCTGGPGAAPRQLMQPGGIAICCGNLVIADTGNRRLAVYSLHGFVLRGFWSPPAHEPPAPWVPVDVCCDRRGCVLAADAANGRVHIFNAAGRWLRSIDGLGAIRAIALDCDDRLYVSLGPAVPVTIVEAATGRILGSETRADRVAGRGWR